eukprot:scaffold22768_cov29-Prasinocladus_malaysianus.AAC.1
MLLVSVKGDDAEIRALAIQPDFAEAIQQLMQAVDFAKIAFGLFVGPSVQSGQPSLAAPDHQQAPCSPGPQPSSCCPAADGPLFSAWPPHHLARAMRPWISSLPLSPRPP